jgi:hypothetical protein
MKKLCFKLLILTQLHAIDAQNPAVFTTSGTKIISPAGQPVNLCGWRVDFNAWSRMDGVSQADFQLWESRGLRGNAQAVEIWWSKENFNTANTKSNPGEGLPHQIGVYNQSGMTNLMQVLKNIAASGSWIIPSIRVSYDQVVAIDNTKKGINTWQGWADHRKVIYNLPVVVEEGPNAGTYGNHRDRFFAWLDWLIPQILADPEVASHIAYWEMWHYYGHKHNSSAADRDQYLDDFIPRLIAKYRQYDPDRLLGVGVTLDATVTHINNRLEAGTYTPYADKNWIYVCGGYGILGILMNNNGNVKTWPTQSVNPTYLTASQEFNIEKMIRLSGRPMHSQEGPGLVPCWRTTPMPVLQRTWLTGLYNLYNAKTNGYAFHAWPPSWADYQNNSEPNLNPTADFDETEFFNITRAALKGNQVFPSSSKPVEIDPDGQLKVYSSGSFLKVEGLRGNEILEVYGPTGSLLYTIKIQDDSIEKELPTGLYFVRSGNITKKIIIR